MDSCSVRAYLAIGQTGLSGDPDLNQWFLMTHAVTSGLLYLDIHFALFNPCGKSVQHGLSACCDTAGCKPDCNLDLFRRQ